MSKSHALPVVVGAFALLVAGCGSSSGADSANAKVVNVKLTDAGCEPKDFTLPAGATTFKVTGASGKVTEFEILKGTTIEGEVENLAPGITKSFTLNLQPGSYATSCPNGTTDADGVLTVTGTATTLATDVAGAVTNYKAYVQTKADELVTRTQAFTAAVIAGDVAKAKELYPTARMPYESIEPVAESFGDLDPAIDARADDTPVEDITGFHRIEYALWEKNSTDGMKPVAEQLLADVKKLQTSIPGLQLDAAKIANGANELLGEVSQSKVTGEEERYSHTDLYDFAANVEGSKAAVDAVRPLLDKTDPELGKTIDARFQQVETDLAPYKTANGGYVLYTTLTQDQIKKLSQDIDALAEPVSQVSSKVANG